MFLCAPSDMYAWSVSYNSVFRDRKQPVLFITSAEDCMLSDA